MSWYKKAYNRGIPLMEEYRRGHPLPSSEYKRDPASLVNAKPEFGGNERPNYPKGFSKNPENSDDPQWAKLHGTIPGESVLMDDGGDSHEGLGDSFVAQDEFNTDNDRIPYRQKQLDNIDLGPHNMQKGNVFNRLKDKIKTRGIKL